MNAGALAQGLRAKRSDGHERRSPVTGIRSSLDQAASDEAFDDHGHRRLCNLLARGECRDPLRALFGQMAQQRRRRAAELARELG